jgi:hypothetical protein
MSQGTAADASSPAPRSRVADVLQLWFGVSRPVDRRAYVFSGLGLLLLKYAVDAAIVYALIGRFWNPFDYINPLITSRLQLLTGSLIPPGAAWLLWTLGPWTLPFLWIGVSMSIRRAADAGLPAWIGCLFLMPIVNDLLIVILCLLPSATAATWNVRVPPPVIDERFRSLLVSAAGGAAVGVAMMLESVMLLGRYGGNLFVGAPFCMGAVTGYLYNRGHARTLLATLGASQVGLLMLAGALILGALEGAVCVAMVYPLAAVICALGGVVGRLLALVPTARAAHLTMMLLAWPLLTGAEAMRRDTPLHEVRSAIEIDAPPAAVWPHVIGFTEMPPPSELVFRLGIAYPQRARIEGRGVGAVRRCEFSTGAFVEPITAWEEPARLSFDVVSQPPPMHEWSPYEHVHAPHLVGNMRSKRGEFRLVPLPGGRTRLEGSTWYELEMYPQAYWILWSDALVHSIHARVLRHIKTTVEHPQTAG